MESSQSPDEVETIINICTYEIWRSSYGKTFLSRDPCASQGACLDTDVIGKRQVLAYCKQHNIRYTIQLSLTKFKFGDGVFSSLGTMQIRIPTTNYSFLKIKLNVVPADVSLLLDLDVLVNEKLVANNVQNDQQAAHHGWSMSLTRKHGQF